MLMKDCERIVFAFICVNVLITKSLESNFRMLRSDICSFLHRFSQMHEPDVYLFGKVLKNTGSMESCRD